MNENRQIESQKALVQYSTAEKAITWGYWGTVILILALSAAYALMPIDLIPDFLIGVGQVDDAGALVAGGGTITFATIMRWIALFIARHKRVRQGLIVLMIGFVFLLIFSAIGLYFLLMEITSSLF